MTTADSLREQALSLARSGIDHAEAIRDLESASGGRRVAVVRARQMLSEENGTDDRTTAAAFDLLDEVLGRLPI